MGENSETTSKSYLSLFKPLDKEIVIKAARETKKIITVEEHSPFGGLGAMVAQVTAENYPVKVLNLSLPDAPVIPGESDEVFKYYGLDAQGIANTAEKFFEIRKD